MLFMLPPNWICSSKQARQPLWNLMWKRLFSVVAMEAAVEKNERNVETLPFKRKWTLLMERAKRAKKEKKLKYGQREEDSLGVLWKSVSLFLKELHINY